MILAHCILACMLTQDPGLPPVFPDAPAKVRSIGSRDFGRGQIDAIRRKRAIWRLYMLSEQADADLDFQIRRQEMMAQRPMPPWTSAPQVTTNVVLINMPSLPVDGYSPYVTAPPAPQWTPRFALPFWESDPMLIPKLTCDLRAWPFAQSVEY